VKVNFNVKLSSSFKGAQMATVSDLESGLVQIAEEIMTDSKTNYVPVDTGNLRNSGFVEPVRLTPNTVRIRLGFGNAAANYALAVHEAPSGYGQGKNKYLTKAMNAKVPVIASRLAYFMRTRIKRRTGLRL
jgi:hypothetical protein